MTTKALRKQLAAAIAMVVVATVALSSSTYAWFAINSKVTATTTSFTTKVSNNLFIAEDTLDSTAKITDDSEFMTALVKGDVEGLLEPVSTINGTDFYYADVTNVLGNGDTKTDEWKVYDQAEFRTNYQQSEAVGYVDYVYQLKAVNGSTTADSTIKLTDLNMFYNKAADTQKAYRVAVFAEDITLGTATAAPGTLKAIYTVSGAANFTATKAVAATSDADTTGVLKDVTYNAATTLTAHKIGGDDGTSYTDGATYYKIVIRVWLEGEDTTCNNTTFANLQDGAWSLSTGWTLGDGTAVTNIAEVVGDVVDLTSGYKLSTADTDKLVINGTTYTKIIKDTATDDPTVNSKAIYANDSTIAASRIFTIDSSLYPTDVTNMVKVN